jgi:hypothetical protein
MSEKQYVLSEQEMSKLFELSKHKYSKVVADCNRLYQHQKKELGITKEEEKLLQATGSRIISIKEDQMQEVLENKMQRVGFQNLDPYYIACIKPISPVIYKAFFEKNVNSQKIKQQFHIKAINEGFEDLIGNAHYQFKRKFYSHGRDYYEKLDKHAILEKFPDFNYTPGDNDGVSNKQISQSWITDYLDHMHATANQQGYNHLKQEEE